MAEAVELEVPLWVGVVEIGVVGVRVGVGVVRVVLGVVGVMFGGGERSGEGSKVGSSSLEILITLGGSSPFFTRMSIDGKTVGEEAWIPRGLLPWARAFALLKHQFCEPAFHV